MSTAPTNALVLSKPGVTPSQVEEIAAMLESSVEDVTKATEHVCWANQRISKRSLKVPLERVVKAQKILSRLQQRLSVLQYKLVGAVEASAAEEADTVEVEASAAEDAEKTEVPAPEQRAAVGG